MPSSTPPVWSGSRLGLNRVRRAAEAANVAVAERVVATNPFRGDGFLTGKNWLAHRLQLSKREAFHRCQMARMHPRLVVWSEAFVDGLVGVEQTSLMAQIAANPRVPTDVLLGREAELLFDAMSLPYEEFKRRALRWQALVDTDGAADAAERLRNQRSATMTEPDTGGWELRARFDDLSGAEFCEVWAHYCQAEFEADWAEAVERLGEGNVTAADLQRTDRQRGADALVAMARAAAACPPAGMRPVPELNILIDHLSLEALLRGDQVPEPRFREVVCRTASGHELDLSETASTVLWAEVRRVVTDADKGHVINYGRKQRLFRGASRKAALLRQMCCIWPGCNVPIRRCEADHARSWAPRPRRHRPGQRRRALSGPQLAQGTRLTASTATTTETGTSTTPTATRSSDPAAQRPGVRGDQNSAVWPAGGVRLIALHGT